MTRAIIPSDKEPVGTPAWRRFFQALAAASPLTGSAVLAGGNAVAVALNPPMPDENFNVHLEVPENATFWVTSKSRHGFTINASAASVATIHYTVTRR